MNIFICGKCGHIQFNQAPATCPVCFSPASNFNQNDAVFKESEARSKEASVKHIPAITINKQCGLIPETGCMDVSARIGKTLHPMEEKHFINFIDCYVDDGYAGRAFLTPKLNPAACFHLKAFGGKVTIVEFCNLHGYWKADAALS
jgi:superoxide reductase